MTLMEKLTKERALEEVQDIADVISDDEAAHSWEDSLRNWFINCMAEGMYDADEAVEVAKIVQSTNELDFARHCA